MEITLRNLRAWVEEHFEPKQYVGTRRDMRSCPVANFLKTQPGVTSVQVSGMLASYVTQEKFVEVFLPQPLQEFITEFDASGRADSRARASTILRIIRELEVKYNPNESGKIYTVDINEQNKSLAEEAELVGV